MSVIRAKTRRQFGTHDLQLVDCQWSFGRRGLEKNRRSGRSSPLPTDLTCPSASRFHALVRVLVLKGRLAPSGSTQRPWHAPQKAAGELASQLSMLLGRIRPQTGFAPPTLHPPTGEPKHWLSQIDAAPKHLAIPTAVPFKFSLNPVAPDPAQAAVSSPVASGLCGGWVPLAVPGASAGHRRTRRRSSPSPSSRLRGSGPRRSDAPAGGCAAPSSGGRSGGCR